MGIGFLSRVIVVAILLVILLVLPLFTDLHHLTEYYIGCSLLILYAIFWSVVNWGERFEKRVYQRWIKARARGFWIHVVTSGLGTSLLLVLIVGSSQYVGNDINLVKIISELSNAELWAGITFLLISGLIIGLISWFENEKRFKVHADVDK